MMRAFGYSSGRVVWLLSAILAFAFAAPHGVSADKNDSPKQAMKAISVADVNAAQQAWCDALVKIGKVHKDKGDYKDVAVKLISELYDYDEGKVFFKPTLSTGKNAFRKTKVGAIAYFVGGNADFPEDKGFALAPWTRVRYDNGEEGLGIQIHGEIAVAMGNVYLTDSAGKEIKVFKTFVFRRCKDGKLRLIVHHSALPFTPDP